MSPVVFGDCFGWLHLPAAGRPARESGVVLCGPVGFEKQAVHRAWRLLADQLAEQGFAVLRFDYPGTGDSRGDEDDQALIPSWLAAIEQARVTLRARSGVRRTILCGLHLGGLLAATAGAADPDELMVLLAPQFSGRHLVRSLRLIANVHGGLTGAFKDEDETAGRETPGRETAGHETAGHETAGHETAGRETAGHETAGRETAGRETAGLETAGLETAGLRLTAASVRALQALDLRSLPRAPARRILVLDETGQGGSATATLAARGAEVECRVFADLDRLMRDADQSQPPFDAWADIAAWLAARVDTTGPAAALPVDDDAVLELPGGLTETVVRFGTGPISGIGIYTARRVRAGPAPAVLVCNTGGNPHYGPGRMSVRVARALAAEGVAVLRIDLPGIGDSPLVDERRPLHLYRDDRNAAFTAAVDTLEALGHHRIAIVGVCSGAFHAMRFAIGDPRIGSVVLVNQLIYDWAARRLMTAIRRTVGWLSRQRNRFGRNGTSSSLFQAQTSRTRTRWQYMRRAGFRLAALATAAGLRPAISDPGRRFAALSARGVRLLIVVGASDASRTLLEGHFGPNGRDLMKLGNVDVLIDGAFDHSMASSAAHARLIPALVRHVLVPPATGP